ncbi:DNA-binding anti-repressor SinI [Peribacillus cavernae]|uniref:DNA-binding anti-repressor SinI n=1 Tax=Peribacillus cavernae TaxID=1674310 RepID=A0A433HTI0_9BACI|nr:anti-repressor SinI family protein [Peribacillus cavernae]RUQ31617.1 DNA-binding anti-repressor SinI [Peribacillus cavernae]
MEMVNRELDQEWLKLIIQAKELGIHAEEVRAFFQSPLRQRDVTETYEDTYNQKRKG